MAQDPDFIARFRDYNDYLDSLIAEEDIRYLQDGELARYSLADCPAVSFRFVYLHSRRWEPSISGGTFETVLQRQK